MATGHIAYMTRVEQFSAAHRLHNPRLSDTENVSLYGACNNANGHGHNYKVEVTVRNTVDPSTGFTFDLGTLKSLINDYVLKILDHKHLDLDVSYFRDNGVVSTTENVTIFIWKQLEPRIGHGILYKVTVFETDKNKFAYKGEVS